MRYKTNLFLIAIAMMFTLSSCAGQSNEETLENHSDLTGSTIDSSYEMKFDTLNEFDILFSLPFTQVLEDDHKTTQEIQEILLATSKATNDYVKKYAKYSTFISRYAFFCEHYNSFYLTQEDLVELEYLEENMVSENVVILYVKPSDIFDDVSSNESESFEIFTAYQNADGVHIANTTNGDFTSLIQRAEFDAVLDKYNFYFGEIVGIKENSDDHLEIIDLIRIQNNNDSDYNYDVRYLFKDDKYAVATVSPVSDTRSVTQYILMKNGDDWEMAIPNVEKLDGFASDINKQLQDFNLELLKNCELADFRGYIDRIDIEPIVDGMIVSGAISEENREISFATSCEDFIYIEFASGEKFIGSRYLNNGVFTVYPVKDFVEAILVLEGIHRKPPLFIVRQY